MYILYRCDLIEYLQPPKNEIELERGLSWEQATSKANALKRANPRYSFAVGME